MRRLILKMSISVDGFAADPNGRLDWLFKVPDEGVTAWTMDCICNAGLHIMGSIFSGLRSPMSLKTVSVTTFRGGSVARIYEPDWTGCSACLNRSVWCAGAVALPPAPPRPGRSPTLGS